MDKHGINRKVFDVAFGNYDPIDHRVFDLAFGRFDPIDVTVFDVAFTCPNGPCNRPPVNQIPDRQGPLIEEVHESSANNKNPVANSESNNVSSSQPASRTPLKKIETPERKWSLVDVSNFANPKVIKKPSQPVSCNEEAEESLDLLENLDDGEDEFFESSQPPQASNRTVQSQKPEEVTTYDFAHANNKLSSLPQSGGINSSSGSRPASQEEEVENDELEEDVQPSQGFNSNNGILRSLYNIFGDGSQVENFESEKIISEPSTSSGKEAPIAAIATNVSEESSTTEKEDSCQTETSAHQGKDHTQEEPSAKEENVTQVTKDSLVSNSSNAPKIKAFKCFSCPAVFLRKFSAKGHFETKHPNEKYDPAKILAIKFVCYECVLAFEIYGKLEDHFTQNHQETIDPVKVILENTQTTASELLKRCKPKPKDRNNAIDDSQSQASQNLSKPKAKGDAPEENVKNNLGKAVTNTPVKIATSKPIKVVSGDNVIEIPAGAIFMESGTDATTRTPKVTKLVTQNASRHVESVNSKSPKRLITETSEVSDFSNQNVEKKKSGTMVPSEISPPKTPEVLKMESIKASELETPKAIKNLMINEVTDVQDNIVSSPRVRKTPVRFGDSNTKLDVTRVPLDKIQTPTNVTTEHASLESPKRSLIEVSDVSNFMTPQNTKKSLMMNEVADVQDNIVSSPRVRKTPVRFSDSTTKLNVTRTPLKKTETHKNDCTPDSTIPKSKHASPESPKRSLIEVSNFATPKAIKKSLIEVNEDTDVQDIVSTPRVRKTPVRFADSITQFVTPKISKKPMIEKAEVATPKGTKKSFMGVLEVSDRENIILTPRVRKTPSRFASPFNDTPMNKIVKIIAEVAEAPIAEAPITEAPSMSKSSGKRRFTQFQREELEKEFSIGSYVSSERRLKLSQSINLTEVQIKHWFSDKRLKAKKGNHAKESKNIGLNNEPSGDKARNAQASLSNESLESRKHKFSQRGRARKRKVKSTIVKSQVITDENQGVQNLANLSEDEITQSPMESQASQGTNSTQKPVIAGATSVVKKRQRVKRVAKSHVIASESQSIQNQASQDKRMRTLSPQKLLPISVRDHPYITSAKGLGGLV